jgi:hypothetical protein
MSMKYRSRLTQVLAIAVVVAAVAGGSYAAPPEHIQEAIDAGVAWLTRDDVQNDVNGSWNDHVAYTCLVLVKLQERAYELGFESPFDPGYPYADNVIRAWQFIFGASDGAPKTKVVPLDLQWHDPNWDDPDTNGNGYGIVFREPGVGEYVTYNTGICAMALVASGTPDRQNDGGLDHDGDGNVDTFHEIAQDAVDWLAFAQADFDWPEGGWTYEAQDNAGEVADQSNSGYAVLGLAYGEEFGCAVPEWVKAELTEWIDQVQCADGGSAYGEVCEGSNLLRTGNLLFEMCFVGYAPGLPPAGYQAMYCLMKGMEYCDVHLLDTDGDGLRDNDWFNQEPPASPAQDLASVLVAQQELEGWWPECQWGDEILCTAWALLTLEKTTPPVPFFHVAVDVRPGVCPNPLGVLSAEELPVAVLGSEEFDVASIEPDSIRLTREGYLEGVAPLAWTCVTATTWMVMAGPTWC